MATTETFNYTGNKQTYTVPSGYEKVRVLLKGAEGNDAFANGGDGGVVEGVLSVSPGETLNVYVGEQGGQPSGGWPDGGNGNSISTATYNFDSGGGGGSTDIRQGGDTTSDRVAVAGGGGGGPGAASRYGTSEVGDGGAGGADNGEDSPGTNNLNGAGGGTQSSGGSGDNSGTSSGATDGSSPDGGDGDSDTAGAGDTAAGGGGGGGYYGGGGGGVYTVEDDDQATGGGGGSNYDDGLFSVQTNQQGGSTGNGQVEITPVEAPAAPDNTSFTVVGDDELSVGWDADTSAGTIDSYDVQVSEDGGAYTQLTNTALASYTYTAPTSVNEFRFRVRAINTAGTSDWSYTTTKSTDPTGLTVTSHGTGSVSLSWTGTDDQSNYSVRQAEASGGPYTEVATPASTSTTVSGLENGEQYYFVVQSVYSGTNSQLSNEVVQTTDLPAPDVSLGASVEDEITVSWTLNDNSTDGSVEICRSTDGTLGSLIHTETNLATTTYVDTGLADGEQYHYTVRRVTDHASNDSSQASAVTVLPAPTGLAVGTVTADTAALSWTANHDNGQTEVQFKPTSDGSWTTFSTLANTAGSETLTGLRNGEAYDARIVATTEHTTTEDI